MEGFGGSGFGGGNVVMKKRRSSMLRRPHPDKSPPSSAPFYDNASKHSLDGSVGYDLSIRKKEFNLNTSAPVSSSFTKPEGLSAQRKFRKDEKKYESLDAFYGNGSLKGGRSGSDLKRSSGVLTPPNWKSASKFKEHSKVQSASPDGYADKGSESRHMSQSMGALNGSAGNKPSKVKLKLSGVTRTIHPKLENDNGGAYSAKSLRSSDAPRHRQKLILQASSDDDHTPEDKDNGLQEVPLKGFGGGSFSHGANKVSQGKAMEQGPHGEQTDKHHSMPFSESLRKSKRVPKRRVLDGAFDDGDGDDGIRYLERLKSSRAIRHHNAEHEDNEDFIKKKKLSNVSKSKKAGYDVDEDYGLSRSTKDSRKKPRTGRELDDTNYVEEEELGSDSDDGSHASRIQQKEFLDPSADSKMEPLTTRRRSLQSGKDAGAGGTLLEFPDGLPPAPPRRQKEKLSEVEQQAKKAEAAQRRRLQVEKQAKELEAEAIRKILGQDSSRKKKEDKERKEREERAQKKAAESLVLASDTIRWVMGPTGTVVTFGDEVALPSIFSSEPCRYPPPREKCAGPSCTNAYKYRDSKLNLPLCSLQCYRAVQENNQSLSTG